jgi:tRNA-dihydrouridine synthase
MLAPLEDITGPALRNICHKYGADLTFTSMAKIESLAKNNASSLSKTELKDDTPTVIQIIGAKEGYFAKFLSKFDPPKGFHGFNLNLGCPSPQIINIGQGCAMIKRITKIKKIMQIFKNGGHKTSIKLRLGLNNFEKNKKIYLNLIEAIDAEFFIVHARHGQETYKQPADLSVYEECVKTGKNIIANGDIDSKEKVDSLKDIGVKGVMIGRAAVRDPGIFNRLKGEDALPKEDIIKEAIELSKKYNELSKIQKNLANKSGALNEKRL